jgi:hypothetical protein
MKQVRSLLRVFDVCINEEGVRFAVVVFNCDLEAIETLCFGCCNFGGKVVTQVLIDNAVRGSKECMSPNFMKSCLHWMGVSYRLYLRDTSILQQTHVDALKGYSDKIMQQLGKNREILPDVVLEDDNIRDY